MIRCKSQERFGPYEALSIRMVVKIVNEGIIDIDMVAGSHSMQWLVAVGFAAITCFVLGNCRGAGFAAQEAQPAIPDLLVVSPSVTSNGLVADAQFTLSATVTNAGDGASPATPLRYYLSTDATFAPSEGQYRSRDGRT